MTDDSLSKKLNEYHERLRRFVQSQLDSELAPKVNASDIVQSAFGDVLAAREQFRGKSEGEWYSYLKTSVGNKLRMVRRELHAEKRDIRRERSLNTPVPGDSTAEPFPVSDKGPGPSQVAAALEVREQLRKAVDQLPAKYAQSVRMRYFEELPCSEIAARLGVTVGTVNGHLKEAKRRFPELLKKLSQQKP
jgi:RNA polymerase sigma-70 factor (ECF subfamily)